MFKDKKEELRRLEQELLLEAQLEEEEARLEEELEEADVLLESETDYGEESEQTYYNYSNRYGRIPAYNNDTTDEDLDAYSGEVYRDRNKRGSMGLVLLAAGLLVGIVLVLGLFVLRFKGIL